MAETIYEEGKNPARRAIPEMSADARFLLQHLATQPEGAFVPYADLNALIGRDVQRGARSVLKTAVHAALTQHEQVWVTVMAQGIKRLTNNEIARVIGTQTTMRVYKMGARAKRKISAARYGDLSAEEQREYNRQHTFLSLLQTVASAKGQKKLAAAVETSDGVLPVNRTLEAFRES